MNHQNKSLSQYLNLLLDSTLDRSEKEILFGIVVELESQISILRDRVENLEHIISREP